MRGELLYCELWLYRTAHFFTPEFWFVFSYIIKILRQNGIICLKNTARILSFLSVLSSRIIYENEEFMKNM